VNQITFGLDSLPKKTREEVSLDEINRQVSLADACSADSAVREWSKPSPSRSTNLIQTSWIEPWLRIVSALKTRYSRPWMRDMVSYRCTYF